MKKGKFTSVWDDGIFITTPAELDEATGELTTVSVEVEGLECLHREFFIDEDDNEYPVCPECHGHILKTVMKEGVGKVLYEVEVCSDSECDNQ
jgi:hypothetical protein